MFYNTKNLPNFVNRDPTVRLAAQTENNKRFGINVKGNCEYGEDTFVYLPLSATNPNTPYELTLEQQCNSALFIEAPINTGAFDVNGNLVYANVKTYYINVPYGSQSFFNPFVGPLDLAYDAELWQAWKAVFGFDKIPIGFYVGFTLQVGLGTQVVVTSGTPKVNFPYVRTNSNNYIPGIGNAPVLEGVNNKFPEFYSEIINSTVYTAQSDADFAQYFPREYFTSASSLSGPVLRPKNQEA